MVPDKVNALNTVNTHVLPFSKRLDNRLSKSANWSSSSLFADSDIPIVETN